ncbi:ATP-dependent Clp protease proteolytic subunit [Candidatus Saccharibacteria bacterium]|nr:ATP-dependent Clp protease proteolytic subunit [Candidatus Saccharibacteria bacterium]
MDKKMQTKALVPFGSFYDVDELCEYNFDLEEIINLRNLQQRKLFLNDCNESGGYDDFDIEQICANILQYNRDDADCNLSPEERAPILLYINSHGGPEISGFKLIDIIELSETPVYTINTGTWYSMALLIGIAGHKRFATSRSTFLLHDGINGYMDSQSKAEDYADFIKKFNSLVVKEYVMGNSAITSEEYEENRRVEWYFLASEAKEKELVDAIIGVDEGYDIYDIC